MKLLALLVLLVSCSTSKTFLVSEYHKGFATGLRVACTDTMFSVWHKPLDPHNTYVLADFERNNQTCVQRYNNYINWVIRNQIP